MPPTRRIADRRAALQREDALTNLVVLDASDQPDGLRIPTPAGLDVRRLTSSVALDTALRTFRQGVIAITVPPATSRDLDRVAAARRDRDTLRILLVNGPDDAAGRLAALARGFDDAISASAGAEEIEGRLLLLAGRTTGRPVDRLPIGPDLELDLVARGLRRHGRLIHLRPMEFRLLDELARNPGRPMSRQSLLRQVWGTDSLDGSRTVDVHVRWLRAKVERDPERPEHLLTVRGVGYQLELGTGWPEPVVPAAQRAP